jgi:heterodisulfide reductase subunit A-like polyferredoxin
MDRRVLVIGGGVTGMQVAKVLRDLGLSCLLLEKAKELGGRVPRLSRTFPFQNEDGFNDGLEFSSTCG